MHCCTLTIDVHIPASSSLKEKRMAVRPLLDGARARFHVAAAELAFQDQWQRAILGFAALSADADLVSEILDKVERLAWSRPDLEIVATRRAWLDLDE